MTVDPPSVTFTVSTGTERVGVEKRVCTRTVNVTSISVDFKNNPKLQCLKVISFIVNKMILNSSSDVS